MSDHFQQELAFLGIESSPAFVRAPEGNGCAERFIRTLKENLLWVQTFDTVEQLRHDLIEFREIYNTTWLIERHRFRPPAAIRAEQLLPAEGRVGSNQVSQKLRAVHVHTSQHRRNAAALRADWQFTTNDARIKLRKLYPIMEG